MEVKPTTCSKSSDCLSNDGSVSSKKRRPVTLEIAMAYWRAGLAVVPFKFALEGGKVSKKPTAPWKTFTSRLPTEDEMVNMFGAGAEGIGLVLGPASGCIIARDWDDGNLSYGAWQWAYPDLAKTLPTVTTPRGYHVYARWPGVVDAPKALYPLDDGELRLRDCCIVLPPSARPDGGVYGWIGEPLDPATCPTIESPDGLLCPPGTIPSSSVAIALASKIGGNGDPGVVEDESQPGGEFIRPWL